MKKEKSKKLLRYYLKSRSFVKYLQEKISRITLPDYTTFSIFSVIIGIAAGLSAVIFHNSISFFNDIFFNQTKEGLFFLGAGAVVVLPAIGMLIQAVMILLSPQISKRKGVPEVIKAVALRGGQIQFRTTLFHFIAPVVCIGSGGTLGPEGPAAQLGGGVASKLGSIFSLSEQRRKVFTAAGAGAAIAAIFNTPLGGVFFALEIILLNDFHTPTFSALIIASVTASAISRVFLGNEAVFVFNHLSIGNYTNLYLYAILGIFSGIISLLFIRYSNYIRILFQEKLFKTKIPQWSVMISVGLLVGISGLFYKEIFGIGYNAINEILADSLTWKVVIILFVLKFILVPLVLYSGGFGGVFAPSLFMGACFGYLFAIAVNTLFSLNIDPATMILVGMGATLGGINSIPISAIMIIFEMTQDYTFILPLMIAVIASTMLVQISLHGSVHTKHLEAEGFRITEGKAANILENISVSSINLDEIDLIPEDTTLPELVSKLMASPNNSYYTVNRSDGKISGFITENELRPIITEYESLKNVIVARDIHNPKVVTVSIHDNLDYVLNLFSKTNIDQFPVTDPNQGNKIVGAISRKEVLSIYNRESLKENLASGLAKELKTFDLAKPSAITEGYSIAELSVPQMFVGKTLVEIKFRSNYGLEVLMIKQPKDFFSDSDSQKILTPDPNYKIQDTDKLIVFGADDKIEMAKKEFY